MLKMASIARNQTMEEIVLLAVQRELNTPQTKAPTNKLKRATKALEDVNHILGLVEQFLAENITLPSNSKQESLEQQATAGDEPVIGKQKPTASASLTPRPEILFAAKRIGFGNPELIAALSKLPKADIENLANCADALKL